MSECLTEVKESVSSGINCDITMKIILGLMAVAMLFLVLRPTKVVVVGSANDNSGEIVLDTNYR